MTCSIGALGYPSSIPLRYRPATTPFVLPGTHLGIFPIGLIITGGWTALRIATLGVGTVGRMKFRDQYRAEKQRGIENAGWVSTIGKQDVMRAETTRATGSKYLYETRLVL